MDRLRDVLTRVETEGAALGHFNVSDLVMLKAVVAAAGRLGVPVLVGASEGEREFFGVRQLAAVVNSLREETDAPIFLNADHTHSLAKAVEAGKAGFDEIIVDFSALPFDDNVLNTREALEAIKAINPTILVEGEIGDIGTGSEIHEKARSEVKQLPPPKKQDSSSSPPELTSSHRPLATCTAWSRVWWRAKPRSACMSRELLRSRKLPGFF